MKSFHEFIKRIKEYREISEVEETTRRLFSMNGFDGCITILGVLIGFYIQNIYEPMLIFKTGIAAAIAMSMSGLWGAYLTERSVRIKDLKELESATISDLNNTKIGSALRFATIVVAVVDAVAPFITAFLALIPFLFAENLGIKACYLISFIILFLTLFLLGIFLGRISKENLLISAIKMIVAGIMSVLIITFTERFIG
jgi:predicted membrane protein (TIGR00267 family)